MSHSQCKDELKRSKEEKLKEKEEKAQKGFTAQKIKYLKAKKARLSLNHE